MPRRIDHEARRAAIAEALVRVAVRDGLHAVTLRAVAAEAGLSLGLVQYSFPSKAALVTETLRHLERRSRTRWASRLAALPEPRTARSVLATFLAEALPSDDDSRAFHLLFTSFAVLAMTDPELAGQPFVAGPDRLERELTEVLARARDTGELAAERDPVVEAALLVTTSHGVGTSVLIGQRSVAEAEALLAAAVERLFA